MGEREGIGSKIGNVECWIYIEEDGGQERWM